ncbi:hypothetical protein [uncultured Ruegeria sp.]|uniref:hypothetical protein n=1 Tax=uncultured Ruegeria sp. TaxID=259304 RepID=UPI00261790C7|nr:hypothetical protein [uncultured Ruegeria sp.]
MSDIDLSPEEAAAFEAHIAGQKIDLASITRLHKAKDDFAAAQADIDGFFHKHRKELAHLDAARRSARNAYIKAEFDDGAAIARIAKRHGLSVSRVRAIINK